MRHANPSIGGTAALAGLMLVAWLGIPGAARAEGDSPEGLWTTPLVGWEYRLDDSMTPPLGEDGWVPLREDSWRTLSDRKARAWLRVRLPERQWPDEALLIEKHFVTAEVWLEGGTQPLTPAPRWHDSTLWRFIPLPEDVGAVPVFFRVGQTELRLAANGAPATFGRRSELVVSLVAGSVDRAVIALSSLGVGLAALLVFLRRREQRAYLYFALFAIGEGLVLLANTDLRQLLGGAHGAWMSLRIAGRALSPPMLIAFLAEVLGAWPRLKLQRWAMWVPLPGVVLVALDLIAHPAVHRSLLYWVNAEIVACTLLAIALAAHAVRRGDRGSLQLLAALLLSAAVTVHERLLQLGFFRGTTWTGWTHLVLLVAIADRLLREFTGVYEQLQREVRGRDEFLSIASHELRNPLAVIAADAELLARAAPGPGAAPQVEEIQLQVGHLTRLVDDLLDVSRLQRGSLTLRLECLALPAAIRSALSSMKHAADARGVELRFESDGMPSWVRADRTRLDQMICNIVRNGIQHTPPRGRVIASLQQTAHRAVLRIADTGEGMSEETMARLFQFFNRGDGRALEQNEGMGVGLALVKQLAELHGGSVSARSDGAGRGSTFILEFPLCEAPAEADRNTPDAAPPVHAGLKEKRSVLLVDDNANLRRSMRLLLEHSGFAVSEAGDGQQGLERLLAGAFDAAVVDLRMPGLDGLEVARRVRASELGPRLRLVALTGFGNPEDRESARQAGFDHLLVKPATPERLVELLAAPPGEAVAIGGRSA